MTIILSLVSMINVMAQQEIRIYSPTGYWYLENDTIKAGASGNEATVFIMNGTANNFTITTQDGKNVNFKGGYLIASDEVESGNFYKAGGSSYHTLDGSYLTLNTVSNKIMKAYKGNKYLRIGISFVSTTVIDSVEENNENSNSSIYDLSGRKVMDMVKGHIYIKNGRKFVCK